MQHQYLSESEKEHIVLQNKHDEEAIKKLCDIIGYGRVMQLTTKLWREKDSKGAFVIGPCAALTVPCGCENVTNCDWCNGTGWITPKVKEARNLLKLFL